MSSAQPPSRRIDGGMATAVGGARSPTRSGRGDQQQQSPSGEAAARYPTQEARGGSGRSGLAARPPIRIGEGRGNAAAQQHQPSAPLRSGGGEDGHGTPVPASLRSWSRWRRSRGTRLRRNWSSCWEMDTIRHKSFTLVEAQASWPLPAQEAASWARTAASTNAVKPSKPI
nr:unnamed protein product [Digitaria exilis]